ncbi:MAG: hypothetical protein ACRCTX_26385 [Afipia sp.]
MTYEAWRCTFQSAEQAALAAYSKVEELTQRVAELEAERAERGREKPVAWLDKSTDERPGDTVWLPGDLKGMDTSWLVPLYAALPITSPVRLTDEQVETTARNHGTGGWQTLADMTTFARAIETAVLRANGFKVDHPARPLELVGLRGCNSLHGGVREPDPCIYRMRTTDPGCTGCAERDEDQRAEAGG